MRVRSLGQEDPQEKGVATHSSALAWEIPGTGEPGWLQSLGSQSHTTETTEHTRSLRSVSHSHYLNMTLTVSLSQGEVHSPSP